MADRSQLVDLVTSLVGDDEQVIGVVKGVEGSNPGIGSLLAMVWPLGVFFTARRRSQVCVGFTAEGVVLVRLGGRDGSTTAGGPVRCRRRFVELSPVGVGDDHIRVGPDRVWLSGEEHDHARRLARMAWGTS